MVMEDSDHLVEALVLILVHLDLVTLVVVDMVNSMSFFDIFIYYNSFICYNLFVARVAELVDAHDSKSCGF